MVSVGRCRSCSTCSRRFVLAWRVSAKESSALAQQRMREAPAEHRIDARPLTIHPDRGAPMTANRSTGLMSENRYSAQPQPTAGEPR